MHHIAPSIDTLGRLFLTRWFSAAYSCCSIEATAFSVISSCTANKSVAARSSRSAQTWVPVFASINWLETRQTVAGLAHAALQDIAHTEVGCDLANIRVLLLYVKVEFRALTENSEAWRALR